MTHGPKRKCREQQTKKDADSVANTSPDIDVKICSACQGVGKVLCACRGMRALKLSAVVTHTTTDMMKTT